MKSYLLLFLSMPLVSLQAAVAETSLNEQLWHELNKQQDAAFDYKPVTIDRIKRLIEAGVDVDSRNPFDNKGQTPLIAAVEMYHFPLVEFLLNKKANPNFADIGFEWAPLHYAARGGRDTDPQLIEVLLKHGADVNKKTHNGETPLRIAQVFYAARPVKAPGYEERHARRLPTLQRVIDILKAHGAQ